MTTQSQPEDPLPGSRSGWLNDLMGWAVAGLAWAFGYLVGERRALERVEKPAMRALSLDRPAGQVPTMRSVMQILEQLEQLAATDPATGVRSRYRITLDLALATATAQTNGAWLGICLLDMDHFKAINDGYGHPAGDQVLAEVGRRLLAAVTEGQSVGRYGGEEFLVILPRLDEAATQRMAERLVAAIHESPIRLSDGTELPVTASVGGAATYGDHCLLEEMAAAADKAMYAAKDAGRDRALLGRV